MFILNVGLSHKWKNWLMSWGTGIMVAVVNQFSLSNYGGCSESVLLPICVACSEPVSLSNCVVFSELVSLPN
jgi:hypothetical protein